MGYRSDIRIMTTEEGFKSLNNTIDNYLKENGLGLGNNLLYTLDINKHKARSQRYFGWNNIIWYTHLHYVYVDVILMGPKELKKENIPYRFTRIGEDISDIEEIINDDYLKLDYINADRRFVD